MVYVCRLPEQTVSLPVMGPGFARELMMLTGMDVGALEPHPFSALTVTLPDVAVLFAVMDAVAELPVQPDGSVHA